MDAADSGHPIEVRYRLNEDDFLALNRRARLLFNLRGWVIDWIAWLIIPALLFFFALFDFKDLVVDLIGSVLFGLVLVPAFPFVRRYLVRKRMKATYKLSDVRLIAEERNIRTDDGEVTVTMSWRSIERGEETRAHFFLFLTRLQALIIPKRAFADAGDVVRLRHLISQQVKDFALVGRS
ncbi:YcxB family protein [Taklimakanibacter lacteus]|uniref:YcxB family protein n=1 Tax=Taklimakanibacter lacteus TaxID=2268456 RepID=UPI000E673066